MELGHVISNLNLLTGEGLKSLNQLLKTAKPNYSFWGTRILTINGYEGNVTIDVLANKVLSAKETLPEIGRKHFSWIVTKIRKIYDQSYALKATGITAIFVYVMEKLQRLLPCYWDVSTPYSEIDDIYMSGSSDEDADRDADERTRMTMQQMRLMANKK